MTKQLSLEQVAVAYDGHTVVHGVGFTLVRGDIGCLLGPSGCGKSTLLRAIAGFEPITQGSISIAERLVSDANAHIAPENRQVGMVFQDFALFPHMNIADNVGFGLQKLSSSARRERVDSMLKLVDMQSSAKMYPHQLSGGQQQRIALVRAIAPMPDILLLDEPFSSLDTDLREQLAHEVRELLKQEDMTAILVTHDQMEAFAMADHIGVVQAGELMQWDQPHQLYHSPVNPFVAEFVGQGILLDGEIKGAHEVITSLGTFPADISEDLNEATPVHVLIRPDYVIHDDSSPLLGEIIEKRFRGAEYLYRLRLDNGAEVLCLVQSHHNHALHEKIGIFPEIERVRVFAR
ncbi:MAG: ABC transporter ATP-binding protein [Pseudomonadota bacterium]